MIRFLFEIKQGRVVYKIFFKSKKPKGWLKKKKKKLMEFSIKGPEKHKQNHNQQKKKKKNQK